MATVHRLKAPPITEAVIEFRVHHANEITVKDLASIRERMSARFPTSEDMWAIEGTIKVSDRPEERVSAGSQRQRGFLLRSKDRLHVVQVREDGLAYSRLAPYSSWEEMAPDALNLLRQYTEGTNPVGVFRIGVRYINHLKLGEKSTDLDTVLVNAPKTPTALPPVLSGFISRVVIPLNESGSTLNIVQALEAGPPPDAATILLDIDVSQSGEFAPRAEVLQPVLERLRDYKNKAFFGSLVEEFLGRYM